MMVGAGGQLLERSIVDRMVGTPERLAFEGGPILDPPLRQDKESRRPIAIAACPPLKIAETARLRELKAKWAHRLAGESAKVRTAFIAKQAKRLAESKGISVNEAMRTIARQCEGILLPVWCCPTTRSSPDAIADPDKFEGATLADPLEGLDYGVCLLPHTPKDPCKESNTRATACQRKESCFSREEAQIEAGVSGGTLSPGGSR